MEFDIEAIAKTVAEKANLDIDQARKAVNVVIDQLKAKMPEFEGMLKGKSLAGIKL